MNQTNDHLIEANINAQDNNGNTALHFACQYFHNGLLEYALGRIGSMEESAPYFLLPFKLLQGETYCLFMVISTDLVIAGADPMIQNNEGETPLNYVPELMGKHKELYDDWIHDNEAEKQLDWPTSTDVATVSKNRTQTHKVAKIKSFLIDLYK